MNYIPTTALVGDEASWGSIVRTLEREVLPRIDAAGSPLFLPARGPRAEGAAIIPIQDVYLRSRPRRALSPQLVYAVSGQGYLLLDGDPLSVPKGRGAYVRAGSMYYPHAMVGGRVIPCETIQFTVEAVAVGVSRCHLSPSLHAKGLGYTVADARLPDVLREWELEVVHRGKRDSAAGKGLLLTFFHLLMHSSPLSTSVAARSAEYLAQFPEPLQRAVAVLHRAYDKPFALAQLAEQSSCSPFHLCRLFRSHLGTTPVGYLTSLRLAAARELLLGSDQSITDVAFAVGYANVRHFRRSFARAFGTSPSAARSQLSPRRRVTTEPPDP